MFSAFLSEYTPDSEPVGWTDDNPLLAFGSRGVSEFFENFSGVSFSNGLYRVMRADAIEKWNEVLAGAFPDFQGRICAFGYDWMGTCFALDKNRTEGGESLVVLFEVDTAEALEVPADFASFHNETLIEQREAALTPSFFDAWISAGGAAPRPDQCVGYKVPLFLGGQDTVENLELTDLAVYWEISSQLIAETRNLPPGTPVKGVSVD